MNNQTSKYLAARWFQNHYKTNEDNIKLTVIALANYYYNYDLKK